MAQTGVDRRLNKTATGNVIGSQRLQQNSRQFNNAGISDTSKTSTQLVFLCHLVKTYFAHKLDKLRLSGLYYIIPYARGDFFGR